MQGRKLKCVAARGKALGQKGQVFTAYNLLIGAVMAAVMLMVILGGLSYVESIKYRISLDRLYQGATNAVNTPNSDIIMVENLTFSKESSFTQDAFSQSMGIPEECISIESWENSAAFEIKGSTITVKQDIQTNVYFKCWLEGCGDSGIECRVSFGSELS